MKKKMFGIYRCPYCKANINHAKGEVVQSILGSIEDGEEDKEDDTQTKTDQGQLQGIEAIRGVIGILSRIDFGVIKVSDYFYERKMTETVELVKSSD